MPAAELLDQFDEIPGLARLLGRLGIEEESRGAAAAAVEFALEGLHLSRRLNKDRTDAGAYAYGLGAEP
jgi:magnesium chelatase subunit I